MLPFDVSIIHTRFISLYSLNEMRLQSGQAEYVTLIFNTFEIPTKVIDIVKKKLIWKQNRPFTGCLIMSFLSIKRGCKISASKLS